MTSYYLTGGGGTTTTSATWDDWNNDYTRILVNKNIYQTWMGTIIATTATSTNTVWYRWSDAGTATTYATLTSGSTSGIWTEWNDEYSAQEPTEADVERARIHRLPAERVLTPEEIRVRDELVVRANERQAVWQRERQQAVERAKQLLLRCLSDEQRAEYLAHGHFVVNGRSGHRYRIRQARSGNVDVVDRSGIILHRLCVHPAEACPDPDTMLVQKLMLEADEASFLRVANPHPHYGERTPILLPH